MKGWPESKGSHGKSKDYVHFLNSSFPLESEEAFQGVVEAREVAREVY